LTVKTLGRLEKMKEDQCGKAKSARSSEVMKKQLEEEKVL
jgi:hypothetical protein